MESQPVKHTRAHRNKNFHFKVDVKIKDMPTLTKYYFTKADVKEDHGISAMTIHRHLTIKGHKLNSKYSHLTITKVCEPARLMKQLIQPIISRGASFASASPKEPSSLE